MNRDKLLISFSDEEYGKALARALSIQGIIAEITVGNYDRIHNFDGYVITDKNDEATGERIIHFETYTTFSEINEAVTVDFNLSEKAGSNSSVSDTRIIVVTGSQGGTGVTSISKGLGKELSLYYDKKTCIISLSLFPDSFTGENTYSFKELLYRLTDDIGLNIKAKGIEPSSFFTRTEDEYYIPNYGEGINPVCLCEEDTLEKLLKGLIDSCTFDTVIVDLPKEKIFDYRVVFSYANNVLLVKSTGSDCMEFTKTKNLINDFINHENKIIIEIENDIDGKEKNNTNECDESEISRKNVICETDLIRIEYDPESFINGEIHIDGSFGISIKNIAFNTLFC
ncbi:MAG: hypothetical protein IJP24_05445 [Firmicutes bacterium]|nr:hypothetical protein [Bacillota bacterium]